MTNAFRLKANSELCPDALKGSVVWEYSGHDYGLSSDDTRMTGIEHISVTQQINGGPPSFTIPKTALEPIPNPIQPIDGDHLNSKCQPGKGSETCRYLTMSKNGWSCEKGGPLQWTIDNKKDMVARGDNCEGRLSR